MKASELRINNWINDGDGDFTVSRKTLAHVEKFPDKFKPIPLTEEWFLKFDFSRHHEDYGNGVIMFKSCINQPKEGMIYKIYPNELGGAEEPKNAQRIKYVHQLQNLYFALTGEELTIKEKE